MMFFKILAALWILQMLLFAMFALIHLNSPQRGTPAARPAANKDRAIGE